MYCTNPSCQNHQQTLDVYCKAICECRIHSAKDCIPVHHAGVLLGGMISSFLKQQTNSYWHQIWMECGSPSVGVVAQIKKKAKLRYKAEARRRKRQQSYIRCQKMGDALAKNHFRDFWKEVKKVNSTKYRGRTAPVMDGVSGDLQIAGLWSTKFKDK